MLKVHHINVGHGDTTFIELPDRQTMLIDCNYKDSGKEDVLEYLDERITKTNNAKKVLDYLVITHPDEDHLCGIEELFEKFEIENIWESGYRFDDDIERSHYEDFLSLVEEKGSQILEPGETYEIGEVIFHCFNSSENGDDDNNDVHYNCLVLKMSYAGSSVLFPGDSDYKCWQEKVVNFKSLVGADYLHASHHGSRSFFMEKKGDDPYLEGLKSIDPSVVIVSCLSREESEDQGGEDQDWPPHDDALEIYEENSDEVLLTCNGNIVYEISDSGNITRESSGNVTSRPGRKKGRLIATVSSPPPKPYYDCTK